MNGGKSATGGIVGRVDRAPSHAATSICLSTVTICSGLYLRIGICLVLLRKILSHFSWYKSPRPGHHVHVISFRISVLVLAVIHAIFAGFTAVVGAFANGGDVWERLLVILLHPLGAAGVLLLVLLPRLATKKLLATVALLTANVIADLRAAQLIATGVVRGDWELALAFSVVPAIGIIYALALLRTARATAG